MNNNNTMSKVDYIFENIFWSVISMIWYRNLLFRCMDGVSYSDSKVILWSLLAVSVPFGVLITWNHRRNHLSLFVNVIMPFEIYSLITYFHNLPILIWIIGIVAVALSALYSTLIMTQRIRNRTRKKAIINRRIMRTALGARTIITCCMSLLVMYLGVGTIFGSFIFSPSVNAETKNTVEEITIANNMEVVSQLNEDTWAGLSSQEKLNTLQTIANIEAYYLGLPHELNVRLDTLSETTLACYDDRTHLITINMDHFDSGLAKEVLDSVCHEAYHAYQHRLCAAYDSVSDEYKDLLIFYDIQHYEQEFSNYTNGKDNAIEYYLQQCEIDARSYAREATTDYYIKINNYLGEEAS